MRSSNSAFLYRTQYVSDCKCQPHPWEVEATERHRMYALTVSGNGDEEGAATSSASHEPLNQTGEKEKVTPKKRPSQRPMSSKPSKNPMSGMSDWRRDIVRSQN